MSTPAPYRSASMTTELVESLYADSALLLKLPPGDVSTFHVKPNFVALEDAKETIRGGGVGGDTPGARIRVVLIHNFIPFFSLKYNP